MTENEVALKLEKLQTKSWVLNSLTLAVHDAIVDGANETSNFDGALHVLTCLANEVDEEIKELNVEFLKLCRL